MKKGTIIALIVAIVLLLIGGILVVMGLSYAGSSTPKSQLNRQEISIRENFEHISIDTGDCDVKFAMFSGRDDCMVQILEHEHVQHSVVVEDGTLKIKMNDERKWNDYVGIFHGLGKSESMEMTVYLPAAEYASLQVRTDTGDITVLQEPVFLEMVLRSDTGDISCVGVMGDTLDCMTSTGDIAVQNSAPNRTKLHSSTGDLQLSVVAGDEVHLQTGTGEVDAEKVNAGMFTCTSDTGEVELEGVMAEEYLQIRTDTGDVGIEGCDAGRVDIQTGTGDVTGYFLTPKWFSANSNTGDVKVPNTPEGGDCRIETDTGDIHFK